LENSGHALEGVNVTEEIKKTPVGGTQRARGIHSHYLETLFAPNSIAVVGASERPDAVGARVMRNLIDGGFAGSVYPVNPNHDSVFGRRCYGSVQAIEGAVDLAVIATPAETVLDVVRDCGERGVAAVVVCSAGFSETNQRMPGAVPGSVLGAEARRLRMRLLGPNCLGYMRPAASLNATFSKNIARPGSAALISQSGALCTAILDWAEPRGIGFSAMVSLGDAADIDFGEMLDYFALDAKTRSILVYVEGIHDARHFISGLRAAARAKPVVVVKAGRHRGGARAALSHTGAMVGADDVFDAALARAGAVRAQTVEQLFAAAQLLAGQHRVSGDRLAIVTNAGGPGVLAADRAADLGVVLAPLESTTIVTLNRALPAPWSHANPVDVLGDAPPERFAAAVSACLADKNVDGVLVVLTPQAMTEPLLTAQAVVQQHETSDKLLLACWMGEPQVATALEYFATKNIPAFKQPEGAVEAFAYLASYRRNQELLLQVPGPRAPHSAANTRAARAILQAALAEGRNVLTGPRARGVLAAFGVPLLPELEAADIAAARSAAETLGYPVALKILSPDIPHKSDVNGVRLNVGSADAVASVFEELVASVRRQRPQARIDGVTVEPMYHRSDGRELHVGVARDSVFGPVVSFGLGGTAVEVLRDRAVALPPLNSLIARNVLDRTRAGKLLAAFRHLPAANREAVVRTLLAVSEMACELPEIVELDINPLAADADGVVALDARLIIAAVPALERYAHMAIHPYPTEMVQSMRLADGTEIELRPIRPEDAEIEAAFVRDLTPRSRYLRFMSGLRELSPQMLVRFTQIDYDRELAMIAVAHHDGKEQQIAVARYITNPDGESCEFAVAVDDQWQRRGIGAKLLALLIAGAKARGLRSIEGEILTENVGMITLAERQGFQVKRSMDSAQTVHVNRNL